MLSSVYSTAGLFISSLFSSCLLYTSEVKKMNEPLQGNFEGIGIQFNMAEDTLLVIQPVSGGPSEKAGIPVSYTHLDVYKRQAQAFSIRK